MSGRWRCFFLAFAEKDESHKVYWRVSHKFGYVSSKKHVVVSTWKWVIPPFFGRCWATALTLACRRRNKHEEIGCEVWDLKDRKNTTRIMFRRCCKKEFQRKYTQKRAIFSGECRQTCHRWCISSQLFSGSNTVIKYIYSIRVFLHNVGFTFSIELPNCECLSQTQDTGLGIHILMYL